MDIQDLRKMSAKELAELLLETEGELRALRFKLASGDLKKVREIRRAKKLIAQINTIIYATKSTSQNV